MDEDDEDDDDEDEDDEDDDDDDDDNYEDIFFIHHPPLRKFKWREQTQYVPTCYQLFKNTRWGPAFRSKSPRARSS